MSYLTISEDEKNINHLLYLQNDLGELFSQSGCKLQLQKANERCLIKIELVDCYKDIITLEIIDRICEILVISYKYEFFKNNIDFGGLNKDEREILLASLISADFEEDKKYVFNKIKSFTDIAIDGIYNFRINPLRKKWSEILTYIPVGFMPSQLKDFIFFLLENKNKKIYIDNGKVYDSHYKRLIRSDLMSNTDELKIVKEVLLSNCGYISLSGSIPKQDEEYLREYFGDKINFSEKYFY